MVVPSVRVGPRVDGVDSYAGLVVAVGPWVEVGAELHGKFVAGGIEAVAVAEEGEAVRAGLFFLYG